ncbi:MAG: hypothetical protein U0R79_07475 [Propionicimonas sp.]
MTIQRVTGVSADVADNTVKTTGTPTAWRNIVDGTADLLVVYEADKTVQAEVKGVRVRLEVHLIGRDALVFFTNSSNPGDLTVDQVQGDLHRLDHEVVAGRRAT